MSVEKFGKKKTNLLSAAALGLHLMMPVPEAHAQSLDHNSYVEKQQELELDAFL